MIALQLNISLSSILILLLVFKDFHPTYASITINPATACVNDEVVVSCSLSVSDVTTITSSYTTFIVGSSDIAISESVVDGTSSHGGVSLNKLTATAPASSSTSAQATITLLSYTSSDNGLRLGCSNTLLVNIDGGVPYDSVETVNIQGATANPPSPPTSFTATFSSLTCSGTVELSWTPGASDIAIDMYILYENGVKFDAINPTNSHYFTKTLQNNRDYTYSIQAESCAGRSSATSSNVISVGDPPCPPTSFTATFNSLTCSGTVVLSWTPGASDRTIETYILYENGVEFDVINPTNSHSFTKTLQNNRDYTYSIKAESCAGRSSATSCNVISVGDPPSPPNSFTATFNSLTCSGTVVLSWTPGASDKTIEKYILYENVAQIAVLSPTNSYSFPKTLQNTIDYTYYIQAVSCIGDSTKTYSNVISIGDPPSPATNFMAHLPLLSVDPNSCYGTLFLSWIPGDSDRIIDMYVLAVNGAEFVSVTTNYHFYAGRFQLGLDYTYSLITMSCAGNSTVTVSNVISIGYVLDSIPTILSYNQSNSLLTIDWSILPNTSTTHPLLIDYSIDLFYNYTQSGDVQNHSDSVLFSLLSQDTNYTHTITPHSYENDYGVETAIRVCIQIIQQCNQAFSGMTQCGEYSIVNPTLQLSTSPIFAEGLLPVVIGSVGFIGLLSIILIVLLLSIFITVYYRFVKKRKGKICCKYPVNVIDKTPDTDITPYLTIHDTNLHETEAATSPPTELEHTEYPSYTPMAALSHKQLQLKPSAYANLSDYHPTSD